MFVTATTSQSVAAMLHPKQQLKFLEEMAGFVGPDIFAESLAYSMPHGNTGWTAFRMGPLGHVTFHHWDSAHPSLLQLDLYGAGTIDDQHACQTIRMFWLPLATRAVLVSRREPSLPFESQSLVSDDVNRQVIQEGLGPGDHLHLLIDQISHSGDRSINAQALNAGLLELVRHLKMKCLTPLMSRFKITELGFEYDAVVGITTSHVALRIRKIQSVLSMSLDVFSCRNYRPDVVHRWLNALLPAPEKRRSILFNRYPGGEFIEN
ncbi:MAG: hypothetical protein C5B53_10465 [Candidatus Melainabacteria bacterium]|nr:MAG: hypothetical protein C5B53_10465 [Candidatus Melainabacteria bacterium]